jgi:hypothetical protein
MLDKENILRLAQLYCNSFCALSGYDRVILTLEDIDVLSNPNLKVANFSKTSHVKNLTENLFYHINHRLMNREYLV